VGAPFRLNPHHRGGEGQTEEEAKGTYGPDRIGPDDMLIFLIGMSQAEEDDQANSGLADNPQVRL